MKVSEIRVIKKDGTKEDFNVQKVVVAVNKSANRAMITFSQAELKFICQFEEEKAESLGVSRQAVSKWESGTADPSTSNLLALAKLFGVSAEELLKSVE